jgi:hypothetical protein
VSLSGGQSSSSPTKDRSIWDLVWKEKVPQKLRVFAWRAATSTLAVRSGLNRRMPKVDNMCTICGMAAKDEHHALVTCTLARALRGGMRQFRELPMFKGTEWLFVLLSNSSQNARPMIIFLLWRVWHHRNNVVHGDGRASVSASIPFLRNYLDSFISACGTVSDPKGKLPVITASADSS